jgi:hypothetical protein
MLKWNRHYRSYDLERERPIRHAPFKYEDKKGTRLSFKILMALTGCILGALVLFGGIKWAGAEEIQIETIAMEASNQPFAAQVAVAEVIKTRMAERHQTTKQVCLAKWQFSCWNKGVHQKPRTKAELATAKRAWKISKATGVNLYHDTTVNPSWVKKVKFVKQVGKMRFYREVKNA